MIQLKLCNMMQNWSYLSSCLGRPAEPKDGLLDQEWDEIREEFLSASKTALTLAPAKCISLSRNEVFMS